MKQRGDGVTPLPNHGIPVFLTTDELDILTGFRRLPANCGMAAREGWRFEVSNLIENPSLHESTRRDARV